MELELNGKKLGHLKTKYKLIVDALKYQKPTREKRKRIYLVKRNKK